MKKKLGLFFFTLIFNQTIFSQQNKIDKNMDAATQKYIEAGTPNENHKKLNTMVGKWKTHISELANPSNKDPQPIATGSAEIKWINEGRFLQITTIGKQMGLPFFSLSLLGYDNLRKKYVSFWSDNSSTTFFYSDGFIDASGAVLTLFGKTDDPVSGAYDRHWKVIWRMINANKLSLEFYDMSNPEIKAFETVFFRE
ncbi:MAG TPA: DUF1579 family protein [Chitinophagaceae bacterium]|nr:DUF1579 family protein [Chitinophagaceae bacterium]